MSTNAVEILRPAVPPALPVAGVARLPRVELGVRELDEGRLRRWWWWWWWW